LNSSVSDIDGTAHGFDLDAILAGAHGLAAAEDRIIDFTR
jgi:hypothetical protein